MELRRLGRAALAAAAGVLIPAVASAQAPTVPDFTQHGFPTVVASTDLAAGAGGSVQYGPITVTVPQGAFNSPVTFELLEGAVSGFQSAAPSGMTVISDFALRVVTGTTGQLVGTFLKPVTFTLTQSDVSSASVYDNVTAKGQIVPNPVPAKIAGDVLTHPITAAMVGWVVLSPAASVPTVPDFTQHGFPTVVAATDLAAGASGSVHYGPMDVTVPQGAFNSAVTLELLQGPVSSFQAKAPAGERVVTDFALRVVDKATGQLVGTFLKPVGFTLTQSGVDSSSVYDNVTPTGQIVPNPVPAKITGDVLTHPIPAAMVGWVVLGRATTVPAATSPTTGVPVLPIVGLGVALIGVGALLVRRARSEA